MANIHSPGLETQILGWPIWTCGLYLGPTIRGPLYIPSRARVIGNSIISGLKWSSIDGYGLNDRFGGQIGTFGGPI